MVKLKLKRKMSGNRIRKLKRVEEFSKTNTEAFLARHERKYAKNIVIGQKRRDNPKIYEGEEALRCAYRNIRVPSKKRKAAQKRFKKAFPQWDIDEKSNKPMFKPDLGLYLIRVGSPPGLNPKPKKKIN